MQKGVDLREEIQILSCKRNSGNTGTHGNTGNAFSLVILRGRSLAPKNPQDARLHLNAGENPIANRARRDGNSSTAAAQCRHSTGMWGSGSGSGKGRGKERHMFAQCSMQDFQFWQSWQSWQFWQSSWRLRSGGVGFQAHGKNAHSRCGTLLALVALQTGTGPAHTRLQPLRVSGHGLS